MKEGPVLRALLAELEVESMKALYDLPRPAEGSAEGLVWSQVRTTLLKVEQYERSRMDSITHLDRAVQASLTNAENGLTLAGTLASRAREVDEHEEKLNAACGSFREWQYVWKQLNTPRS